MCHTQGITSRPARNPLMPACAGLPMVLIFQHQVSYIDLSKAVPILAIWLADVPKDMLEIMDEVTKRTYRCKNERGEIAFYVYIVCFVASRKWYPVGAHQSPRCIFFTGRGCVTGVVRIAHIFFVVSATCVFLVPTVDPFRAEPVFARHQPHRISLQAVTERWPLLALRGDCESDATPATLSLHPRRSMAVYFCVQSTGHRDILYHTVLLLTIFGANT